MIHTFDEYRIKKKGLFHYYQYKIDNNEINLINWISIESSNWILMCVKFPLQTKDTFFLRQ